MLDYIKLAALLIAGGLLVSCVYAVPILASSAMMFGLFAVFALGDWTVRRLRR